jgi:thiamine-monophosphate kinase
MASSEFLRIARLASRFGDPVGRGIAVGIGDDAAVLEPPNSGAVVWTVDAQVEGVHFRREWMTLLDVGWRSFVAAASDLSAMGAAPWCALSAVTCPAEMTDDALDELTAGQALAARELRCPVVGGNLTRGSELSVTTTLLGTCERPILRSGAVPGDSVWIAGAIGLAAAGLRALQAGSAPPDALSVAIETFRRPAILTASGLLLGSDAHAAIDVSDGLAADVAHLARASRVGVVLDAAALLEHAGDALVRAAVALGEEPLELALHGGEDYALVATSVVPIPGFSKIGQVEDGDRVELSQDGRRRPLEARGFDHFAR